MVIGLSALIFSPARRMRSLPISQIVWTLPMLSRNLIAFLMESLVFASEALPIASSKSSGSCTIMLFLCPPSSAFNCITACAVVALPEKKSIIIAFLSSFVAAFMQSRTAYKLLGNVKGAPPNSLSNNFVPYSLESYRAFAQTLLIVPSSLLKMICTLFRPILGSSFEKIASTLCRAYLHFFSSPSSVIGHTSMQPSSITTFADKG